MKAKNLLSALLLCSLQLYGMEEYRSVKLFENTISPVSFFKEPDSFLHLLPRDIQHYIFSNHYLPYRLHIAPRISITTEQIEKLYETRYLTCKQWDELGEKNNGLLFHGNGESLYRFGPRPLEQFRNYVNSLNTAYQSKKPGEVSSDTASALGKHTLLAQAASTHEPLKAILYLQYMLDQAMVKECANDQLPYQSSFNDYRITNGCHLFKYLPNEDIFSQSFSSYPLAVKNSAYFIKFVNLIRSAYENAPFFPNPIDAYWCTKYLLELREKMVIEELVETKRKEVEQSPEKALSLNSIAILAARADEIHTSLAAIPFEPNQIATD